MKLKQGGKAEKNCRKDGKCCFTKLKIFKQGGLK